MALASATAENNAVTGLTTAAGFTSIHTATPGTTGASEVSGGTYARQATAWGTASGGSIANTGALSFPIPASTSVSFFGTWSLVTAGVYQIGGSLGSTITFTTAGTLTIAVGALTLSAS